MQHQVCNTQHNRQQWELTRQQLRNSSSSSSSRQGPCSPTLWLGQQRTSSHSSRQALRRSRPQSLPEVLLVWRVVVLQQLALPCSRSLGPWHCSKQQETHSSQLLGQPLQQQQEQLQQQQHRRQQRHQPPQQ
jgi:hypothetical protein